MAPELALGGLQRWLQAVIVHPGPVDEALAARRAAAARPRRPDGSVVLPSARLTAPERVGVYHGMYLARMREALESDYPGLARFLGPAAWERLVQLATSRPTPPAATRSTSSAGTCRISCAPRACVAPRSAATSRGSSGRSPRSFDAPETPPLTEAALAAVAPGEWERARLVPVAALRLVALEHDAGAHLDALREGRRRPPVRRRRCRVVVYRRNFAVFRREQTAAGFALLEDLVNGLAVGRALARAVGRRGARLGADEAFRLFHDWAAMGLFSAVR